MGFHHENNKWIIALDTEGTELVDVYVFFLPDDDDDHIRLLQFLAVPLL